LNRLVLTCVLLLPAAWCQTVTITAPGNNTVAAPGQTISVTVSLNAASDFEGVALVATRPIGLVGAQAAASSVSFAVPLPSALTSAQYVLTAIGYTTSGAQVSSDPITLLVEGPAPASLIANPAQLYFKETGAQLPVMLGGAMADGSVVDMSRSPQLTWSSSNTAVATVSSDGVVTSVANGTATITAKMGNLSASTGVTVTAPATPCTYTLDHPFANETATGGSVTVNVTASATTCGWSAASGAAWVTGTARFLAAGNGAVNLSVANNSGAARSATISIAGRQFLIAQAGTGGTSAAPAIAASGVVNGASFVSGGVVPGEIATIFGSNLTSATGINLAAALPLASQLLSIQVLLNGIAAPIFAVDNVNGQQQINFQVPYEIAGETAATLQVINDAFVPGNILSIPVLGVQPGIFGYSSGAVTYGAILHANYQLAGINNPARANETVLIYCTGLGAVSPQPGDGAGATGTSQTAAAPTVTIGGLAAPVTYSGLAPGYVGLYQINATVPSGLSGGNQPVVITIHGTQSPSVMLPVI
jgi:uncharacterized protein (TIGR03437 family)